MKYKTLEEEIQDVFRKRGMEITTMIFNKTDSGNGDMEWVIRAKKMEESSRHVCDYCHKEFRHNPICFEDDEYHVSYEFCSEICRSAFIKEYKKSVVKKVVRLLIK